MLGSPRCGVATIAPSPARPIASPTDSLRPRPAGRAVPRTSRGRDLDAFLQHDRPRVHPGVHEHDADARLGVAICKRALHRRRAAIPRQERRMHVSAPKRRRAGARPASVRTRPARRRSERLRLHLRGKRFERRRLEYGNPQASAASLTGVGTKLCPRPEGRSGCVTTPAKIRQPRDRLQAGMANALVRRTASLARASCANTLRPAAASATSTLPRFSEAGRSWPCRRR